MHATRLSSCLNSLDRHLQTLEAHGHTRRASLSPHENAMALANVTARRLVDAAKVAVRAKYGPHSGRPFDARASCRREIDSAVDALRDESHPNSDPMDQDTFDTEITHALKSLRVNKALLHHIKSFVYEALSQYHMQQANGMHLIN